MLDFIIDILLGCASSEVRDKASALFFRLSQAQNQASKYPLTQVKLNVVIIRSSVMLMTKCAVELGFLFLFCFCFLYEWFLCLNG